MTTTTEPGGPSFEMQLHAADELGERISAAIERAIVGVDGGSPRAAATRSALHRLAATLWDVPLTRMVRLAALDAATNGSVMATVNAALATVGPPPLMAFADAAEMLSIFDGLVAQAEQPRLH